MSEHTPGPWYRHCEGAIGEQSEDGDCSPAIGITNVDERYFEADGNRGDLIAWVPRDRRHEANANLIAAAPDLLEVCENVAGDLESLIAGEDGCGMRIEEIFEVMLRSLREAIGKAKGVATK